MHAYMSFMNNDSLERGDSDRDKRLIIDGYVGGSACGESLWIIIGVLRHNEIFAAWKGVESNHDTSANKSVWSHQANWSLQLAEWQTNWSLQVRELCLQAEHRWTSGKLTYSQTGLRDIGERNDIAIFLNPAIYIAIFLKVYCLTLFSCILPEIMITDSPNFFSASMNAIWA